MQGRSRQNAARGVVASDLLAAKEHGQTVEQAKQQAAQAAETAATAVSRGALFGALGLLLGAVAGWFGGRMGAVEPTLTAGMGFQPTTSGSFKAGGVNVVVEPDAARAKREGGNSPV